MSKYLPLKVHLQPTRQPELVLDFTEVEKVLGDALPASARKRKEWWSNERSGGRHVQPASWMEAGYQVANVDFSRNRVVFRRSP